MLKFKTYLREEWKSKIRKNEWGDRLETHIHSQDVHGHVVKVEVTHDSSDHEPKHYDAAFYVNNQSFHNPAKPVHPTHARAIINHVASKLKEFKEKKGAKAYHWQAEDTDEKHKEVKQRIYARLAKRVGAKVTTTKDSYLGGKLTVHQGSAIMESRVKFHSKKQVNEDYQGEHLPADKESGAPLHNLTHNAVYPKDVYSHKGFDYYHNYGSEGNMDRESHDKAMRYKDQPDKKVWIHRAVPKHVYDKHVKEGNLLSKVFHKGAWVTIHKDYAKEHGHGALKGDFKVVRKQVPAKHIYTDGNSIHEWGYHPDDKE